MSIGIVLGAIPAILLFTFTGVLAHNLCKMWEKKHPPKNTPTKCEVIKAIEKRKQKEETLIKMGLYKKVYNPENNGTQYSETYPEFDCKSSKFYKKVAIQCTDEQVDKIANCKNLSEAKQILLNK